MKNNKKSISLSWRISLHVLIFSVIFFIATLFIIFAVVGNTIIDEAIRGGKYAIRAGSEEINGQLLEIEASTRNLAWQVNEYSDDPQRLERVLKTFVRENEHIFGCSLAPVPEYNRSGFERNAICAYTDTTTNKINISSLYDEQYDYLMTNWYLLPKLLKQPVWTEPYFDEGNTNNRITTYAYPVKNDDDEVIGVIAAHINLEWLTEVARSVKSYSTAKHFILSKGGVFVSNDEGIDLSNESMYSITLENGATEYDSLLKFLSSKEDTAKYFGGGSVDNGEYSYAMFMRLHNGWFISIYTPYDEILDGVKKTSIFLLITAAVGLVIIFILLTTIIRRETKSIKQFSSAARSIATGNFETKLPDIRHKDETYTLGQSLDYMQKELKRYIDELTVTTAKKQGYEKELLIAKSIQTNMIPSVFPENQYFDVYGIVDAAKEIGGDLFGYNIDGDRIFFFVGDVSGKGIPAALYMSFVTSAMEMELKTIHSLSESITKINDFLCSKNDMEFFITFFCGCIDTKNSQMEYCNCGHNPIVIVSPDGKADFLNAKSNLVLSAMEGFKFQTEIIKLEKGSRLVLYTDGVTEAEKSDFTQYSEKRLLQWANSIAKEMNSHEVTESLKADVLKFTNGNPQNDDMTIFTITYTNE